MQQLQLKYTSKVSFKLTRNNYCVIYRSDQLSNPTEDSVAEIEKCVESDHCGSGNDPDITDKKQQSDSTPTRVR